MYQFRDVDGGYGDAGRGGGAAALAWPPSPAAAIFGARARPPLLPHFDLVVDLGARIGSREWLRGFVTCGALCYAAWSLAPPLDPLAGASPPPFGEAQWGEIRALSFTPLAAGATTGRRMAATDAVRPLSDFPERPSIDLTVAVGGGDFSRALTRAGVAGAEAARIEAMIAGATPLGDIKPGTVADLTLGRRPDKTVARPLDSIAFRARFDLKLAVERVDGALQLRSTPIAVDDTPLRIQGRVGSSLYRAARASGAPPKAVEAYLRAIAGQVNVSTLAAGDRFDIIVAHRRAETGETEVGKLLFAGLERTRGKAVQLMPWDVAGTVQWYEASGIGKQTGLLQRPVPGRVSSNFGMRRHPILGFSRMHKGMDFRAGYGTPILAATDGTVTLAGWAGGYGQQVRLRHAGGLTTSYSHMSRIVARRGGTVKQGQVIGYVGSTGLSTGPHLHYEIHRNGTPINPASVKFTERAQLSGADLARFKARLREMLAVPVGGARRSEAAPAATPAA